MEGYVNADKKLHFLSQIIVYLQQPPPKGYLVFLVRRAKNMPLIVKGYFIFYSR